MIAPTPTASRLAPFAQADLLHLAVALLSRPTPQTFLDLPSESEVRDVVQAANVAPDTRHVLAEALVAAITEARLCGIEAWSLEYSRLFEGPMMCPINESMFVRRDKGAILADITAFHQAFGVRLNTAAGEKADHLVAELELLAWLLVLAGSAQAEGREREAEVAQRAATAFATDHLGEWLPAFCNHVVGQYALPVIPLSAVALLALWRALAATHGWANANSEVESQPNVSNPTADAGTPYECGMAEAGVE